MFVYGSNSVEDFYSENLMFGVLSAKGWIDVYYVQ